MKTLARPKMRPGAKSNVSFLLLASFPLRPSFTADWETGEGNTALCHFFSGKCDEAGLSRSQSWEHIFNEGNTGFNVRV